MVDKLRRYGRIVTCGRMGRRNVHIRSDAVRNHAFWRAANSRNAITRFNEVGGAPADLGRLAPIGPRQTPSRWASGRCGCWHVQEYIGKHRLGRKVWHSRAFSKRAPSPAVLSMFRVPRGWGWRERRQALLDGAERCSRVRLRSRISISVGYVLPYESRIVSSRVRT